MNTPEQDWIIDHVGATNWAEVARDFANMTAHEIEHVLDIMFASEDNSELARRIHAELAA